MCYIRGGGCHSDWTRGTPKPTSGALKVTATGLRVPRGTYLHTYIYTNTHTHTHIHVQKNYPQIKEGGTVKLYRKIQTINHKP